MVSASAEMGFSRRSLFFGVIVVISITTSIIFFANVEAREHYVQWIISISASTTVLLAISIVYQQKHHHRLIEKADVALAIALGLSLSAEIVWAIYEIILEVVPPVPSWADAFSITAYASLGYYVFSTYLRFYKQFHFSYVPAIAAIIASALFLTFIIAQTLNFADLSSYRGVAIFTVIISYPILDAIIMVPAFLIVVNYKKEPRWFTPWIFKSAGIFLVAISDSWFALFVVTSITNELWPSAMIFAAHNVIIAAGLLWYTVSLSTARTNSTFNNSDNSDFADNTTRLFDTHIPRLNGSKARATSSYVILFTLVALSVLSVILIVANLFPSLISIWSVDRFTFFSSSDTTEGTHEKAISVNPVKIDALLPLSEYHHLLENPQKLHWIGRLTM